MKIHFSVLNAAGLFPLNRLLVLNSHIQMFIDELKLIMKYKRALRHVIYHRCMMEEEEDMFRKWMEQKESQKELKEQKEKLMERYEDRCAASLG